MRDNRPECHCRRRQRLRSGSTAAYAGVDFPEVAQLSNFYLYRGRGRYTSGAYSGPLNKRNSIFAAEILASRRLLSRLNSAITRVGVVTFGEGAWLRQPLTHDLVTDGLPTLPNGGGAHRNEADIDLTIDAARQAETVAIAVNAFGLGERATSNPRALVGVSKESGGSYVPVLRPADILVVMDKVSAVGVDSIQVTNETTQQNALQSRLAIDGFFSSAVPVVKGLNRIQLLGRGSREEHLDVQGTRKIPCCWFKKRKEALLTAA